MRGRVIGRRRMRARRIGRIGATALAMILGAVAGGALGEEPAAEDVAARTAASRAAVKAFSAELLGELQTAMAAGGPVAAIEVCQLRAPEIARGQSAAHGWTVGRTSLRTRNPANAPDAWERAQLDRFAARQAAGEDVAAIEVAEVVPADGGRAFRYMKAIPMGEACLACHGSRLAPDVEARLAALYPDDAARGFAVGDLRGAFTIRQPIP